MAQPSPAPAVEIDRVSPYLMFLFLMLSTATLFDGFDAGMLSFVLVMWLAPETRGLTLEQIQDQLATGERRSA